MTMSDSGTIDFVEGSSTQEASDLPQAIGAYQVQKRLGEPSGQAEVFLAEDRSQVPHRLVAIKWARPGLLEDSRKRLIEEGRLLAQLNVPGLVRVIDVGEHDGRPFVVLEFINGTTLANRLHAGRPSPREAARLVACVAHTLHAVHDVHVLHRDLKPDNIVIAAGKPRLIDFGMAELVQPFTSTNGAGEGVVGTPAYMAPEQARSEAEHMGPWSDVFGLGGILYHLLTGCPPYMGTKIQQLVQARECNSITPPREIDRGIPPALERICQKALAPKPSQRYRSAAAMEWALRFFLLRRWIVVAFLAAVSILAVVSWRGSGREAEPTTATTPAPAPAPLRIETLEVRRFRGNSKQLLGAIGVLKWVAQLDDNVEIAARLSAPAYCYLIALNPDGSVKFCPEKQATQPPGSTYEIVFPADPAIGYGLTDGTGLQAFVLVASRKPLPAFTHWPAQTNLPWDRASAAEGVWKFDRQTFHLVIDPDRGTERPVPEAAPAPFAAVCRRLSDNPDVDAIQAIAFPVVPVETSRSTDNPAP
jgi:serine/threonine protein kinase